MTVVSARATATHGTLVLTPQLRRDICQWDVGNWARALDFWNRELSEPWDGLSALELGAGRGGLSLYFALRGCKVTCTDLKRPAEDASSFHDKYDCAGHVTHAAADATAIPFSDDTFDFVAFKSLLGTVGRRGGKAGQQQACGEIHRVLKPGGALLFAENLSGAAFHAFCRRKFVPWGGDWRYVTIAEVNEFLGAFGIVRYRAFGVLALFGRAEWQRTALHYADLFLSPLAPERARYMIYGIAKK